MKRNVTRNEIKLYENRFYVGSDSVPYFGYIMSGTDATGYNCGVYGWNFDLYTDIETDTAIMQGYRNYFGKKIPCELVKKYSQIAQSILYDINTDGETRKQQLSENRQNFYAELIAT